MMHVTDFGPVGTPDDGPVLQSAINYVCAQSLGGELHFPPVPLNIVTPVVAPKVRGKRVIFSGEGAASTVLCNLVPSGAYAMTIGSEAEPGGNVGYTIRDIRFAGVNKTGRALRLYSANAIEISHCKFEQLKEGIRSSASFDVAVDKNHFAYIADVGFFETVACHHLKFTGNNVHEVGYGTYGGVVYIDENTVDVICRDNDIEVSGYALAMNGGGSSIEVDSNWLERLDDKPIVANATIFNLSFNHNDLNQSVSFQLTNVDGGSVRGNHLYNQAMTFGSSAINVDVGPNRLVGSSSMGAPPWSIPSGYLNGWGQGSRPIGYRKNNAGELILRGELSGGASNAPAFTLPSGYRPAQSAICAASGAAGEAVRVSISTSGNVTPVMSGGSLASLDGVRVPIY